MQSITKRGFFFGLIGLCLFANAQSVCQKKSGEMICGPGEVDTMGASGVFKATETQFKKRLVVKGQAIMTNCRVNEMKVFGQALLSESYILGKTDIHGHLDVINTQFKKSVAVQSDQLRARGSSFTDLVIGTTKTGSLVELLDNTIVAGDVVFRGQPGTVLLSGGSRITGKIINGKQQ